MKPPPLALGSISSAGPNKGRSKVPATENEGLLSEIQSSRVFQRRKKLIKIDDIRNNRNEVELDPTSPTSFRELVAMKASERAKSLPGSQNNLEE
jgi:hypothetical protein